MIKEVLLAAAMPIATLAYWLSICLIGAALFSIAKKKIGLKTNVSGIEDNYPLALLVSFGVGALAIGVFCIPLYLLRIPAVVASVFYIILLLLAVVYYGRLFLNQRNVRHTVRFGGVMFWLLFGIVGVTVILLIFDYVASGLFGTILANGSDSYVHIARILSITQYGFSVDDGFFKGIAESRYNVNLLYSLYVPSIQLLHITPADAWNWSFGFFRFLQWMAIGALGYFVANSWLRLDRRKSIVFAAASIIFGIASYAGINFVAGYPNTIVNVWLTLLIIGTSLILTKDNKQGRLLIALSSILLALTHPTYALMAALFIGLLTVIVVGIDSYEKRRWQFTKVAQLLIVTMLFLLITPVITTLFPDRMAEVSFNFGGFETVHVLGADILKFTLPVSKGAWSMLLLSLIGYAYLLWRLYQRRSIRLVALVGLLISFIYLLAYNPLFMGLVHEQLPIWLVDRFWSMNVLQRLGDILGIWAILQLIVRVLRNNSRMQTASFIVIGVVIIGSLGLTMRSTYRAFYDNTKGKDPAYPAFIERTHDTLNGVMPDGSLVITSKGDGYFLPAVIPIHVIAIDDNHATPVADSINRTMCTNDLLTHGLDATDLKTVNADYVVIAKWDTTYGKNRVILEQQPRFVFVKETNDFIVYKIDKQRNNTEAKKTSTTSPCYLYQKVEGSL